MTADATPRRARIFVSYAREDERFRKRLEKHLVVLQREGRIATWSDRKIVAGDEWEPAIDTELQGADVVLFLVSPDLIASDFVWNKEIPKALELHARGLAQVVPIVVRFVEWPATPFSSLQALPTDGKAVTLWSDKDRAWADVTSGIRRAVDRAVETPRATSGPSSTEQPPTMAPASRQPASDRLLVVDEDRFESLRYLQELVERFRGVARIEDRWQAGVGTGFLVAGSELHPSLPEVVLLTCTHIVSDFEGAGLSPDETFVSFGGIGDPSGAVRHRVAKVLWSSRTQLLDMTILALDGLPAGASPIPLAGRSPLPGVRVSILGHPRGLELPALARGRLVDQDQATVRYRARTEPGSGGSPVLTAELEAFALHRSRMGDLSAGILLDKLRQALLDAPTLQGPR